MLPALASRMALRRRALASGSPPPVRAATVISLMNLVKMLPRFASVAPFLCLIECHFECPDILSYRSLKEISVIEFEGRIYHRFWSAATMDLRIRYGTSRGSDWVTRLLPQGIPYQR